MIFEHLPSSRCLWKSKLPYFLLIRMKDKVTMKVGNKNILVLFFLKQSCKIAVKMCTAINLQRDMVKMSASTHMSERYTL